MGERFRQPQEPRKIAEEAISAAAIQELELTGAALEGLQQARDALKTYQSKHPELQIDILNPRNNSAEIRQLAMMEYALSSAPATFNESVQDKPTGLDLKEDQQEAFKAAVAKVLAKNKGSEDTLH